VFARGRYGKPKLQNAEELRFSVAHSEDVVVLAVTRGRDVGVDVEFARPEDDLLALANRSFSRAEYRALASLPKNQILPAFYRTWTQKEAFVKLLGTGLQLPLDSFDVEVDVGRPCRLLAGRECSSADLRCALMSIPAPRGYAGALAVLGEAPAIRSHTLAPF
jgi:4'-phosphopantetheinyl transferase